mmetsp:Transcript_43129/g.122217  ORF Transcript_43129/g.122217 Transcript_43129/m.122217 type:complete len:105 (-) Transcript_43129:824-1138(-)
MNSLECQCTSKHTYSHTRQKQSLSVIGRSVNTYPQHGPHALHTNIPYPLCIRAIRTRISEAMISDIEQTRIRQIVRHTYAHDRHSRSSLVMLLLSTNTPTRKHR